MTDPDSNDTRGSSPAMSLLLRVGAGCALVGIVVGGVLAYRNLGSFADLLKVPAYGHYMIPSLLLGGVAAGTAVAETVRTGRYARPLGVFALGLTAMATPLLLGIAVFVLLLAVVVTVLSDL